MAPTRSTERRAPGTLLFRVDAGPSIGVGHFVRSVALAEAWRSAGGQAVFVMRDAPAAMRRQLETRGIPLVARAPGGDEPRAAVVEAARQSARAVVLDGYAFGADVQDALFTAKMPCVVVDDNAEAGRYVADVVVNGNLFATESLYGVRSAHTRLLLGPRYALLRPEFLAHGNARSARSPARRVLVTFGGSDPTGLTVRALEGLATLARDVEVVVLVGPTCASRSAIAEAATKLKKVRVLEKATDVPAHMAWADVALTAAGSTCLELAFMGLGAVAVVAAPNQRAVGARVRELGIARTLDDADATPKRLAQSVEALLEDGAMRAVAATCGPEQVDGHGAARVVAAIQEVGQ